METTKGAAAPGCRIRLRYAKFLAHSLRLTSSAGVFGQTPWFFRSFSSVAASTGCSRSRQRQRRRLIERTSLALLTGA